MFGFIIELQKEEAEATLNLIKLPQVIRAPLKVEMVIFITPLARLLQVRISQYRKDVAAIEDTLQK